MIKTGKFNWSVGTAHEQIELARASSEDQLREIACGCDWNPESETVLGWIMAQRCIDLCTALRVFMTAGPEELNYISKRNVRNTDMGRARLLDNICLRINCGFYLPIPGTSTGCRQRVAEWVSYQTAGRHEGREGRWLLDENILQSLLVDGAPSGIVENPTPRPRQGILAACSWFPRVNRVGHFQSDTRAI